MDIALIIVFILLTVGLVLVGWFYCKNKKNISRREWRNDRKAYCIVVFCGIIYLAAICVAIILSQSLQDMAPTIIKWIIGVNFIFYVIQAFIHAMDTLNDKNETFSKKLSVASTVVLISVLTGVYISLLISHTPAVDLQNYLTGLAK